MSGADIRVEVKSLNLKRIGAEMAASIDDEVNKSAQQIVADAKLSLMNPPKTGRSYKRGKKTHQASAPGEAPATDTGALVNSGTTRRVFLGHYQCVFSTAYAQALEYGTPRIEPRPYLRPALQHEEPVLIANIKDAMGRAR